MQIQSVDKLSLLPKRPRGSYSNKFKSFNVATNHFKVQVQQFPQIHIFSVIYNPKIPLDNTVQRRKLLEQNIDKIKSFVVNPVISGNNIFSTVPPKAENFEVKTAEYTISCKKVKQVNLKNNPNILLSFLNNGLRGVMRGLNYIEIGRSGKYFKSNNPVTIDNLYMFSGYRSNFVLLQNGYFLRVDSAKKIVSKQTVLQFIDSVYKINQNKQRQEKRLILQGELSGKVVMTNYGKTAYYRVQEVVFKDMDTIMLQDTISLRDYYQKKYELEIKPKQPLLKVQSKRKDDKEILLVPELCLMTGIPQNFDESRRKKISQQTIKPADKKQEEILNFMKEIKGNPDLNSLKDMGIKINNNLQTVKGRIIPMPKLNLGENNAVQQGKEAFFNLFNKPIYANKYNIKCGILYFTGTDPRPLLDTFESTSRNLKVKFQSVKICLGQLDIKLAIQVLEERINYAAKEQCNICLILLPNQLKGHYKKIKNSALVKNKMVCQMATETTLRKKNIQSIATKILLQIIAKRGNTLWVPKIPPNLGETMMIAFESAKAGSNTTLAMCATVSSVFSSIYSTTMSYSSIDSKFNVMVNLTLKGVDAYCQKNKEIPSEVIIFNSSTSNDQIVMFQEYYIKKLRSKLDEAYRGKSIAITMVMINLKTCERFFTEGDKYVSNVPAGTLISTGIVSNFYDFFVVSQASNKGSTVPNHYKVIYSNSKLQQGILQELVFSQCFNYVNWTGSIKVPGILQYASKCAKFNCEILQNEQVCDDLQSKLYYV